MLVSWFLCGAFISNRIRTSPIYRSKNCCSSIVSNCGCVFMEVYEGKKKEHSNSSYVSSKKSFLWSIFRWWLLTSGQGEAFVAPLLMESEHHCNFNFYGMHFSRCLPVFLKYNFPESIRLLTSNLLCGCNKIIRSSRAKEQFFPIFT